jgi:hypothetical protein
MARQGRGQAGRGDGAPQSWRYNALPYKDDGTLEEDELKDTGTSPVKNAGMEVENSDNSSELGAKRMLALSTETINSEEGKLQGAFDNPEAMVTDETILALVDYEEDKTTDRTKRSKKDGADSPSLGSAGSRGEPVREQ